MSAEAEAEPAQTEARDSEHRNGLDGQLGFLVLLGLPAFGLALASTVVSTYLPVLIERRSGPGIAGLLIGGEGAFALLVPSLVGAWSDRIETRFGPRVPFVLAGAVLAALALVAMPIVGSLLGIALALIVFYAGYFSYYTSYRSLYPDVVPARMRGRAVGVQGTWRSAGLGAGMAGGGVLLGLWQPLPFVVAAAALPALTLALVRARTTLFDVPGGADENLTAALSLLRDRAEMRWMFAANSLWEFTVAALKTFVVLFLTVGLGRSLGFASIVLATVAGAALVAAPLSGWASDRFGDRRVIEIAAWVFGIGLLTPLVTVSPWAFPLIFLTAFAAVVLITLPYSLLMGLMHDDEHGTATGVFAASRGVGVLLGPLAAGGAIEASGALFESTEGYTALFVVSSAGILASIPALRRLSRWTG